MSLNKKHLLAAALASSLLVACSHEAAKPQAPVVSPLAQAINNAVIQKSPNDDRSYAAILLPNQLQVVLVSDPSLENSAASLAVAVGSAQDPVDQQGLAHYLEHMLFLGTEKFPEPDGFMKYTQANGGMTNAFTGYDKTNYLFQINAGKFDEALDRFSDYFKSPTFDAHFADKERNAVNNEWSLQKAQDSWNLFRLDGLLGNPASPNAKFNIGNLETLSDKPGSNLNDHLRAFYKQYYSANTMRLTLVGKQSIPELKALAEKHFANIPNKNIAKPEVTIPGLTDAQKGLDIRYNPIKDLKSLYVDFPVKSNKALWRLKPNEYVNNLITSEELGTLCEQLRKLGYAVNVTAFVEADSYGPDGYLRVQADLTDVGLQHQDEIIAAIFNYIDLIKRDGLNVNYYKELQAMRGKDFDNAGKPNPLQQAVQLTMAQYDLPVENLLNADFIYEKFDEQAIKDVLNQLDKRKARIWHISEQEKVNTAIPFFEGKYDSKPISAEQFAKWDELGAKFTFNLPPLNNLFTDKPAPIVENTYLKPHLVLAKPGVEAFVQQPQYYREDKGQLWLEINNTFAQKTAKNVVLSQLLNSIYLKQNLTLKDRADRASLGLNISTGGANSQAINLSGYTTKHSLLLEELLHSFAKLEISPQLFNEALVSYKQGLANSNKDHVFRQLQGHLGRLTNKSQWRREELLAAADKVTIKDVQAYYQAVKKDPLLRILAVGNYSEEAVKTIAQSASAILPGKRLPEARTLQQFVTPHSGQKVEFKESVELADSAVLQAWFRDSKSDDEQAQLVVLNALFGNAFFMQLRTNEQLGYVVTSSAYAVDEVPGFLMLVQSSNSDLGKIKARMDKFRQDYLATLKATDPADIEQAKQSILANVLQKPTDFYKEAALYTGEFWNAKYKFDARERQIAALKKVTKEDVVKMYESLLLNDKAGALLVQLRGTNFKDAPFQSLK
jgi:protease III